jgi:gas vesicle protein
MREDSYGHSSDVLMPFLLGAVTGAALALLYAPFSGRETRDHLRDGIARGAERGRELRDRVVDKGRGLIDGASEYLNRSSDERSAVEAGREAFSEERATMSRSPE